MTQKICPVHCWHLFFFFFFPLTFGISKPVSGFIFNRPPKTYIMLTLGKALNLLNCRWCYSAEERRCIGEPPCITMCNWESELLKKNKKTEQSANPAFFLKRGYHIILIIIIIIIIAATIVVIPVIPVVVIASLYFFSTDQHNLCDTVLDVFIASSL